MKDDMDEARMDGDAAGADWAEIVRAALASHRTKRILVPPIPSKKEANVRAALPERVEILGLVDMTLFGSAKNALVFTSSGLHILDDEKSWAFAWDDLVAIEGFTTFAEDTIGIRLRDGVRKLDAGTAAAEVKQVLDAITSAELTRGGSRVLRHTEVAESTTDVAHADDERLTQHLERVLGGEGMVWHEIVSDRIHLDVHVFAPTPARPYHALVTSGMSALPMTVPAGLEQFRLGEVCLLLPPDWPLNDKAFRDEANYWPIRLLKMLGRLPHDYKTWLGYGHSIPNGDPAKPYAPGCPYTGVLVIPPFGLPEGATPVAGTSPIHLWQLLPVTSREMQLKLDLGIEALLDQFEAECPDRFGPLARQPKTLR